MTALPLQRIGHEDRLTLTGHLEELRARLVVCVATLAVLFGVCFWQSPALLRLLDCPLASVPTSVSGTLQEPLRGALTQSAQAFSALSRSSTLSASDRRTVAAAARSLTAATRDPQARKPITTGLGEPFSTSVTVAFAFAIALGLPVLLWQLWGFLAPAIAQADRR